MTDECLRIAVGVEPGSCGVCRRALEPDDRRLEVKVRDRGEVHDATVCRWCLSEYAPALLELLEAG